MTLGCESHVSASSVRGFVMNRGGVSRIEEGGCADVDCEIIHSSPVRSKSLKNDGFWGTISDLMLWAYGLILNARCSFKSKFMQVIHQS